MEKYFLVTVVILSLVSCATPVFKKDVMETSAINLSFPALREAPGAYKGKLFIFGGKIVTTKISDEGSLIEGFYAPVDPKGRLEETKASPDRFLALYPKERGLLEPDIYREDRKITVAGEFIGTRKGKIEGMEYVYPFFIIKDIHLWEERKNWTTYPEWNSPYSIPYPYWGYGPHWDYPFTPLSH
jgi:outer membrane lipoprotein